MSWKKYLGPVILAAVSALAIICGIVGLYRVAESRINNERKQQLEELTVQLSDTFENALAFNRACVGTAANLFEDGTYATQDDLFASVQALSATVLTEEEEEEEEEERRFFLLDEKGACYDADGKRGIWGDFDQVAGMDGDYYTFIADSTTYNGVQWAFVRKLDTPVTTQDGSVTIRYVVLLKSVGAISRYYTSEAYASVCQTYVLKENGTRMYDSVTEDDVIQSYNVYKTLRETDSLFSDSFDEVLAELEENAVACGNYQSGGIEYCYSLAWQSEYQVVLLFLIPSDAVAVNTIQMVGTMMWFFVFFGVILLVLALLTVLTFQRLSSSKELAEVKEDSLREQERINQELEESNKSLVKAKKATEQALDIAKSANRAKSSFLSNMSHDIRTPLNAILGFQKLLTASAGEPEKVRDYADKIAVAGNHLLTLINDVLDMSRIESGKTTLNPEPFKLGGLIEELKTLIGPQSSAKHQTFTVEVPPAAEELSLLGDRGRLSQILTNILSNAVKYTPDGGRIEFKTERLGKAAEGMAALRFTVRDNGIGMTEEFQKRVFEPFVRESNTTTSGVAGTGLGMAITKNLVDLMGGIILVESRLGQGSVFTVELSFRLADSAVAAGSVVLPVQDKDILCGVHFLVAEDNDINGEVISELLNMEGASCQIAKNGQEALEMFCAAQPGEYDAILMDIQMPVMNGYEATRAIRASGHPEASSIPIAAMTANAFAEDVQKALEAGMNIHITKPVDMEKLKEFIRDIREENANK